MLRMTFLLPHLDLEKIWKLAKMTKKNWPVFSLNPKVAITLPATHGTALNKLYATCEKQLTLNLCQIDIYSSFLTSEKFEPFGIFMPIENGPSQKKYFHVRENYKTRICHFQKKKRGLTSPFFENFRKKVSTTIFSVYLYTINISVYICVCLCVCVCVCIGRVCVVSIAYKS